MDLLAALLFALSAAWHFVWGWIWLFVVPFYNLEMLWILVPIWLNWFFAEFYQEKRGTSLGNAITNGAILIWVGIDWMRYLVSLASFGGLPFGIIAVIKYCLAVLVGVLGFFIVVEGIRTKGFIHVIGRVRMTTYVLVVFTPIIYGGVSLTWEIVAAIVVFAPVFYWAIEVLDRLTPDPRSYGEGRD